MDTVETAPTTRETLTITTLSPTTTKPMDINSLVQSLNPSSLIKYCILDLTAIDSLESPAWFRNVRSMMKQQNLILVGVRNPQLNLEICKSLHLPIINKADKQQNLIQTTQNTYIDKPIRSGQQVYAQSGSLIAASHVSAGAEVAAIDDIHVYGACSGKVLAGVKGNTTARIYINSGFPELLSIAGITLHSDALKPITGRTVFLINNGQITQVAL